MSCSGRRSASSPRSTTRVSSSTPSLRREGPPVTPLSPRLLKGGLVRMDPGSGRVLGAIAFQYNPDQVTRQLQQAGGGGGRAPDPCRNSGDTGRVLPPTESFRMAVELD